VTQIIKILKEAEAEKPIKDAYNGDFEQ